MEQRLASRRAWCRETPARRRSAAASRVIALVSLVAAAFLLAGCDGDVTPSGTASPAAPDGSPAAVVTLPKPRLEGPLSVEEALAGRRSVREYTDVPLTLGQLSQLLWAAQGITERRYDLRTAPSAGGLYPLEVYVAVELVDDLRPGVYRYVPHGHRLEPVLDGSVREQLCRDALSQTAVADAPVTLALTAVYERTTGKYGERGLRYVAMEAGHAAQNVYLQAVSLGLGTVVAGAFDDDAVRHTLGLRTGEEPLYLMPVGRPSSQSSPTMRR